jgi:hypothetical protein
VSARRWLKRRPRPHADCTRPCDVRVEHHDGRVTECTLRPPAPDEMLTLHGIPEGTTVWVAVIPAGTRFDPVRDKLTAGCLPGRTTLTWIVSGGRTRYGPMPLMPPGLVTPN